MRYSNSGKTRTINKIIHFMCDLYSEDRAGLEPSRPHPHFM